ncbi:MAG: hypothetical protein ACXWV1_12040 [Chitinophagaceae bacterium]
MKKLMSIKNFINDLLGTTYQEGSVFSTQHSYCCLARTTLGADHSKE